MRITLRSSQIRLENNAECLPQIPIAYPHIGGVISIHISDIQSLCRIANIFLDFVRSYKPYFNPSSIHSRTMIELKLKSWYMSLEKKQQFQFVLYYQISLRQWNYVPNFFTPTIGIPQGSNSEPLIFLTCINGLITNIQSEKFMFAEDATLFAWLDLEC